MVSAFSQRVQIVIKMLAEAAADWQKKEERLVENESMKIDFAVNSDEFRSIFGVNADNFRSKFGENILQTILLINHNSNIRAKKIAEQLVS